MADADSKAKIKAEFTVTDDDGNERAVTIRRGKVKHMVTAQRVVGTQAELIPVALAQQLVEIDGEKLALEDWEDVDLGIWLEVAAHLMGKESQTRPVVLSV